MCKTLLKEQPPDCILLQKMMERPIPLPLNTLAVPVCTQRVTNKIIGKHGYEVYGLKKLVCWVFLSLVNDSVQS